MKRWARWARLGLRTAIQLRHVFAGDFARAEQQMLRQIRQWELEERRRNDDRLGR